MFKADGLPTSPQGPLAAPNCAPKEWTDLLIDPAGENLVPSRDISFSEQMKMFRERIATLVRESVGQLGEELDHPELQTPTDETPLMGEKSGIDSIALVSLIVEIETRLSEELDMEIVLADDRAMSSLRSPFRRVGTLIDFLVERTTNP